MSKAANRFTDTLRADKFGVKEPYEFRGRRTYRESHPRRGTAVRRFFARVRDGFTLSRLAFDDVDMTSRRSMIERRR